MKINIKVEPSLSWKLLLRLTLLCGFSWVDCACSPGCLDSIIGDGNCDEDCNNWECEFDNHDCGQCASGCFPTMLANGECNPECNNEDCLFDYNDCQCSDNCFWTDYGSCKPECLVASCNYDQIKQYPGSWCQNTSLAIFSSYQQIIRDNFSYVVHIEDCYEASNYNCTLEKAFSMLDCYEECNIFECNYANGNCEDSNLPCGRSYNNSYGCLSCRSFGVTATYALKDKGCISKDDYYYFWIFPDGSNSRVSLIDIEKLLLSPVKKQILSWLPYYNIW